MRADACVRRSYCTPEPCTPSPVRSLPPTYDPAIAYKKTNIFNKEPTFSRESFDRPLSHASIIKSSAAVEDCIIN